MTATAGIFPFDQEISFDDDARADYLTGFRKRKQARIKKAQEIAAEKARKERIEMRKQMRDERKQAVEDHVEAVNKMLREAEGAGATDAEVHAGSEEEEWGGIHDEADAGPVDVEEEYIDEDRYTSVTIESVTIDRDGIHKPELNAEDGDEEEDKAADGEEKKATSEENESDKPRKDWPKKKKKKFRYETKLERRLTETKRRAKSKR